MLKITDEQQKIISCDLDPGEILRVIAFAGTGKTTTLVEYTKKRPGTRFLYLAFNKSVQMEAEKRFPSNVTARTSHALGFRAKGYKYKDRLVQGFKANQVMAALGLKRYQDARFAMDTLCQYLVSADPKVSHCHVPVRARIFYRENNIPVPDLVSLANDLGRLMCNGLDKNLGMLHDGYLKLFQLSAPLLPYDCILLDEAQDINPVTASIVFSQVNRPPSPSIILVGDGHQQIYSFRGAKDALKTFPAVRTNYLTQSFRFDNNIARVANMILSVFKNEGQKIMGTPVDRKKKKPWDHKSHTLIARTNAGLFDRAVKLGKTKEFGFVGGVDGYRLSLIKDVYYLYTGETKRIKDSYVKSFKGFSALRSYARTVEDYQLSGLCKMVEKYTRSIPGHVDRIMAQSVPEERAGILLTTAHKSKGLEWDNVLLADDFHPLVKKGEIVDLHGSDPDEFNLIYVAITRARINLRFDKDSDIPLFVQLMLKREKIRKNPGNFK